MVGFSLRLALYLPTNSAEEPKKWSDLSNAKELVFPSPKTGKRLDNINNSWSALVDAAKVKNFRFHDLRHHFASRLVMGGRSQYSP
jgi:integrase